MTNDELEKLVYKIFSEEVLKERAIDRLVSEGSTLIEAERKAAVEEAFDCLIEAVRNDKNEDAFAVEILKPALELYLKESKGEYLTTFTKKEPDA